MADVNPYDEASVFSKLTYAWVKTLLDLGARFQDALTIEQIPPVAQCDEIDGLHARLQQFWDAQAAANGSSSHRMRLWPLLRTFRRPLMLEFWIAVLEAAIRISMAVVLGVLVRHFEDEDAPASEGFWAATVLVVLGKP
eukprot:scaffold1140_cov251-Pinguiococcus_pyrenoidosus.AAC.12